jgi:hypothetical protein
MSTAIKLAPGATPRSSQRAPPGPDQARRSFCLAHSDKSVQYLAVRYTQRLAEAGAVASVGSTGDSYDNALADTFNSLFKAGLVRNGGPWRSINDLEIAVAEYVDWFNHRRLHGEIGLVPPVEHEDNQYRDNSTPATVDASLPSLHRTRRGTGCGRCSDDISSNMRLSAVHTASSAGRAVSRARSWSPGASYLPITRFSSTRSSGRSCAC